MGQVFLISLLFAWKNVLKADPCRRSEAQSSQTQCDLLPGAKQFQQSQWITLRGSLHETICNHFPGHGQQRLPFNLLVQSQLGDPAPKCRFPCSDGVSWLNHKTKTGLPSAQHRLTLGIWGSLKHPHLLIISKHFFMVSSSCGFTWNKSWIAHRASSFCDCSDCILSVKQFSNANYKSVVVWHLDAARLLSSAHVAWPCVLTLAQIARPL